MDNIDSPFHRMAESEIDRKIKANKDRFVAELQPRIKANPNIFSVELMHIELSTCLFMEVGVTAQSGASYLLKIQYEMDKHTFNAPRCFIVGGIPYSYDFSTILFQNPDVGTLLREIMQATFEVSKLPGFGTRRGDNWTTDISSVQLANEALCTLKITC